MRRFIISTMAVVLGLTMAASQAIAAKPNNGKSSSGKSGGPQVVSSQKVSGNHQSGNHHSKPVPKDFHKDNQCFHDKDYCKHFTSKYWCASFGCYCYWSPIDDCYFFWYEPFGCYCPFEYLTLAYPKVIVTQPTVELIVVPATGPMAIVTP